VLKRFIDQSKLRRYLFAPFYFLLGIVTLIVFIVFASDSISYKASLYFIPLGFLLVMNGVVTFLQSEKTVEAIFFNIGFLIPLLIYASVSYTFFSQLNFAIIAYFLGLTPNI